MCDYVVHVLSMDHLKRPILLNQGHNKSNEQYHPYLIRKHKLSILMEVPSCFKRGRYEDLVELFFIRYAYILESTTSDRHDIAEILLKVALITISTPSKSSEIIIFYVSFSICRHIRTDNISHIFQILLDRTIVNAEYYLVSSII